MSAAPKSKKSTRKTTTKKTAPEASAAPAKKATAAAPAPAKKAVRKAAAAPKKAVVKQPAKKAVKAPARKTTSAVKKLAKLPARKSVTTTVIAKVDAGFGNAIYLRGNTSGLSWEQGTLMDCQKSDEWVWQSNAVTGPLEFKVLLNDQVWSSGPNGVVLPGATFIFEPSF